MAETKYDVAIVGAGFSGPILAAKIAEKGVHPQTGDRLKVALIEAGPYFKGAPRPGYGSPLRRQMFTNLEDNYQGTYLWDNDRSRAKIVGGTSLHWGAQAFLPFPIDYLHWQKETGVDWSEENLREGVAEIRREFNVHQYPDEIDNWGNKLFYDVAKQMGYDPRRQSGARRNCIYCGFCNSPMMCKYDSRVSTMVTYIPVAEKNGVEIIPDTYVEKILIDAKGGRGVARGLLCRSGGSSYEITADKIMVTCGYMGSPLLLMRSGYGPREWRGNPIMVENPNIGKHIDGHPRTPGVSAIFDEPLGDGKLASIGGYYMIHDERADGEGRLLFRATFGNDRLPSQSALHPFAPWYGREHKKYMREKGILRTGSLSPSVSKPSGRWYLDPDGKLLYGGDHSLTILRAKEGRQMAYEVLQKMGAKRISSPLAPVRITPRTGGSHKVGSCRAGVDPKESVVNPYFESHDVDNLFVCDGSAIPRVTTGNTGTPQASVTVFAVGRIIERHFKA
ncbi:GMC family oxidoreductase [Acidobacteria bacterium AH-259-D05]|nr:GMC family oxidoreductase [Acidobacteria bacterium AH-259-D05]